MTDFKLEIN